jgi:hypothetical protein
VTAWYQVAQYAFGTTLNLWVWVLSPYALCYCWYFTTEAGDTHFEPFLQTRSPPQSILATKYKSSFVLPLNGARTKGAHSEKNYAKRLQQHYFLGQPPGRNVRLHVSWRPLTLAGTMLYREAVYYSFQYRHEGVQGCSSRHQVHACHQCGGRARNMTWSTVSCFCVQGYGVYLLSQGCGRTMHLVSCMDCYRANFLAPPDRDTQSTSR